LIDLGVPIGDTAINLGIAPKFATSNALQDPSRLDGSFLISLLSKHSSGLKVLAAPNELPSFTATNAAVDRLLSVARQNFENVVVDAGSRLDLKGSAVFDDAAIIYLVTQVGISELRNANRIILQFFGPRVNPIQLVLNRYVPNSLGFDDEHITKALTMPAHWKIPNDYVAAQRTQNTATAIALNDSPISRQSARWRELHVVFRKTSRKSGFSDYSANASGASSRPRSPREPDLSTCSDLGDVGVAFPTDNRHFANANLVGKLIFYEVQTEARFAGCGRPMS
jgi:hypothetical protein